MPDNPQKARMAQLRTRLLTEPLDKFSSQDVLQVLLSYCTSPKADVNELAVQLRKQFGTFSQVLDAHPDDINKVNGITPYAATFLRLVAGLAGYYEQSKFSQMKYIKTPADLGGYCASLFVNDTYEKMYAITLSQNGRLLGNWLIGTGIVNGLSLSPRDVLRKALQSDAYAVVLTHNHPGGSLIPSSIDVSTTQRISSILAPLKILLLDHIIVAGNKFTSLLAHGSLTFDSDVPAFVKSYAASAARLADAASGNAQTK